MLNKFMIDLPSSLKVLREDSQKISVEIQALYPGYGVTIGNALRRVLLSSLEGAAITQVKIKGVPHEFSTISGVKEDVLEILLNLKQVKLKISGEDSQKIKLKASGEKEMTAADIEAPTQVEVVNKDAHIASLTSSKAKLEMEMTVEKGLGYVPVEEVKKGKSEVGTMYIDAIFSPVEKCSFKVENIRVGTRTDYNKLKLDVETDGTITPREALQEASRVLTSHFSLIEEWFASSGKQKTPQKGKEKKSTTKEKASKETTKDTGIEQVGELSTRTVNALKKAGITTLKEIANKEEKELKNIKGLGQKGVTEIREAIKKQ